jgi:adenylylsulfate kinase
MLDKPQTLWILGPTSSGKSTIAEIVCRLWRQEGAAVLHFDGDELRDLFGAGLSFDPEDRLKVVKSLVHFANKCADAGVCAVVSALTANPDAREYVFANTRNLVVCSLQCSIEACAERDPKQLYEKARRGEIQTLIGYNAPYMPPARADMCIDSEGGSPEEAAAMILRLLRQRSEG